MRTYDITLTISPNIVVWPEDPPVNLERVSKMEDGAIANVSRIAMSVHTGTHIDAPFHFIEGGETVENISLRLLTGRAYVLHLPDVDLITTEILENANIPPRTRRVLFRTRNSEQWKKANNKFNKEYVSLSADGAEYLINRGVKLVGVDYLSVAPFNDVVPTHQALLEAGVVIVEGLNLSAVSQGRYTLYCLPLKLANSDGAPARAILVGV
ncbi:MAG: cyclase family protein [Chloroflexi bacterium]|nr:cyclase family protein [Chloroflexota bacterium]